MEAEPPPLFPPAPEPRFPLVLLAFTGLSLFAHAATFFLFQVVYPQHVTLPPPSPQLTLLTPDTPEQEALLRWVAAEDPALVAASAGAEPPGVLDLPYHPSYTALRTPPRTAPEPAERVESPPSPIRIQPGLAAAPPAPALPRTPVATTVTLSGALRSRTLTRAEPWTFRATAPLQPVQFLLALTGRGEPRFSFLQRSSGDEQADAAAARWLAAASFSPGETPLTWGVATLHWGDDASAPAQP